MSKRDGKRDYHFTEGTARASGMVKQTRLIVTLEDGTETCVAMLQHHGKGGMPTHEDMANLWLHLRTLEMFAMLEKFGKWLETAYDVVDVYTSDAGSTAPLYLTCQEIIDLWNLVNRAKGMGDAQEDRTTYTLCCHEPVVIEECDGCEGNGGGKNFGPMSLDDGAWVCKKCEGEGKIHKCSACEKEVW